MTAELRDVDFGKISRFVYDRYGINLHDGKKELVKARLSKRLKEGNFGSFGEYFKFVMGENGTNELIAMIDSLSTNLTSFFREEAHFRKLGNVIPGIVERNSHNGHRIPELKIWCAGCSTGEEPYSLAMTVGETLGSRDVYTQVLATDISTRVLKTATTGIYSGDRVKNIPMPLLRKYFQVGQGKWKGHYRVKNDLKGVVKFMRFNLMEKPDFKSSFDTIFCSFMTAAKKAAGFL
jgi:chemotaxis protein methyltransferase CheR